MPELMDNQHLATELFAAATRRAGRHGVRLGDGADSDIRQMAVRAAALMLARKPELNPDDPMIQEARSAFEQLVEEMVSASGRLPRYRDDHVGVIGEETLAQALRRLCPLFPIC